MSKYKPEIFKSPFCYLKYTLIRELKDCKHIGFSKKQAEELISMPSGANATANFICNDDGSDLIIVVYLPYSDIDVLFQQSLIVHEAVHIWQELKKRMNEKEPSSEFEAYSIQRISQDLLYLLELSNDMD